MTNKIDIWNPGNNGAYPYWPLIGQNQYNIPGEQIAGAIQDVDINRIPSETDYNNADINVIPVPGSPAADITGSLELQASRPSTGVGAGVGLMDLMMQSIQEVNQQGKPTL